MDEMIFGRRYRVTEKLGSGGMADVYKAVDEVLGRTVAVKVMRPQYASDPSYAARFRQEASAAANIASPNVVNMYDWGQDGETYYIVMEYVRGTDLKTLIEQEGHLDSKRVASIGAQVAAALGAAHRYDVIHRDIKPQNIMVQPDGDVKVMDFGIARAGGTTMTQTGSVLGTAHYVSPEQAQGRQLTAASDLYSLGVVLYEAATGKVPFDADAPVAVALKQVNEQAIPPRTVNPGISLDLEAVITRAMAKDPTQRYHSAAEMRNDLLAVADGRAPETAVMPAVVPAAAHTSVMPAVGAPVPAAAPMPARRKQKRSPWPWIVLALLALVAGLIAFAYYNGFFDQTVSVPNVTGDPRSVAASELAAAGLVEGTVTEEFDDTGKVPAGIVISQDPVAGIPVDKGASVNLVVSKGIQAVSVPKVTGMKEAAAFKALQDAGLQPTPGPEEYSSKVPQGDVIKQDPAAGKTVPKGTVVTYVVSRGTQLVKVPNVVGQTLAAAQSTLTKAKLKFTSVQDFSDTVASGKVISQNPTADVSVDVGTVIALVVSKGPASVMVPKLVDLTEAEAKAQLTDLGLKAKSTYVAGSTPGNVVDQNPPQGTEVKRGSTVEIFVVQATP